MFQAQPQRPAAAQAGFTFSFSMTDGKNNIQAVQIQSPGSMIRLDVQETETCPG